MLKNIIAAILSKILHGIRNFPIHLQIATFCGQQGRISRTVRAILRGQLGEISRAGVSRPADQY